MYIYHADNRHLEQGLHEASARARIESSRKKDKEKIDRSGRKSVTMYRGR